MKASAVPAGLRLAPASIDIETRADGVMLLRSPQSLGKGARVVGDWVAHWARHRPAQTFLSEREGDGWRELTYASALEQVRRLAQGLLVRGLSATRPVAILSDNSIEHALLALAAMHVGVPVVPVSPAYSLMSADHAKLRYVFELVKPGLVYAADPVRFAGALAAVGMSATPLNDLMSDAPGSQVDAAHAATGPDTVAKILFTSGSTGMPKGVLNTQRMITTNQQQAVQLWPFLADTPPVVVDWLPWNHTFGGNFTFHLVLANGGTMAIDGGKPAPGLIETSVQNLKQIAPTMYFNVPRGFDLLMPYLESDEQLRRNLFSRCRFVFYAGAALPQNLYERFSVVARASAPEPVYVVSAWGSTETAPLATAVHFPVEKAGVIGLPVPGCELKLVPSAGKLEVRLRGPNVTPGYFGRDDLTAQAFDDEGYYKIGDALKFVDPAHPELGLAFDGRVAEDFKLVTGTWVHVGALRVKLIAACDPVVQDAVITGHDRDEIGALLFLNPAATSGMSATQLRQLLSQALAALAADAGGASSLRIGRVLALDSPPQLDAGEITDKGYINQRAVLQARAAELERLYAQAPDEAVILCP
ncbi:MAG: feruloyl-CoA synthase [Quisquiliibacterium sp.]